MIRVGALVINVAILVWLVYPLMAAAPASAHS